MAQPRSRPSTAFASNVHASKSPAATLGSPPSLPPLAAAPGPPTALVPPITLQGRFAAMDAGDDYYRYLGANPHVLAFRRFVEEQQRRKRKRW